MTSATISWMPTVLPSGTRSTVGRAGLAEASANAPKRGPCGLPCSGQRSDIQEAQEANPSAF